MKNIPIGQILVENGFLKEEQLFRNPKPTIDLNTDKYAGNC